MSGNTSTYFVLREGLSLRQRSLSSGIAYVFNSKAVLVADKGDITLFRSQPALFLETDKDGKPLRVISKDGMIPKSVSVYKGDKMVDQPSSRIHWKESK